MYALYALTALLFFVPTNIQGALKCKYGEQTLCGSDGFTYFNMCDFEIVKSVRPDLTVQHPGPCRAEDGPLLNTLTKILNLQQSTFVNSGDVLRRNRKKPPCRGRSVYDIDLTKVLLSQMTNSQTNLDAFNFGNNSMHTQGDNNIFKITIGKK